MIIDKEFLEKQKKTLEDNIKRLEDDYKANKGGLQVIDFLLMHIQKPEPVPQEQEKTNG